MTPESEPSRAEPPANDAERLDRIAWQVLGDLLKPNTSFGALPQAGLQHLIGLRLVEEARRHHVAPEALAVAFDRAWWEFTGRDRPPRQDDEDGDEDDAGPPETVEDL
jgi:hypothetical protein